MLRMGRPLRRRAHERGTAAGGVDGVLELESVAIPDRRGDRGTLDLAAKAKHAERGGAVMGEIAVEKN